MKTIESQRSATILQFPRGGRAALAAARTAAEAYPSLPKMVIGDAWYHDAAMQDEQSKH